MAYETFQESYTNFRDENLQPEEEIFLNNADSETLSVLPEGDVNFDILNRIPCI